MVTLAGCHPQFADQIGQLAEANNKTAEEVYQLWRKYSRDCQNFDQSAILSEFLKWYEKDLPNLPEGFYRLG